MGTHLVQNDPEIRSTWNAVRGVKRPTSSDPGHFSPKLSVNRRMGLRRNLANETNLDVVAKTFVGETSNNDEFCLSLFLAWAQWRLCDCFPLVPLFDVHWNGERGGWNKSFRYFAITARWLEHVNLYCLPDLLTLLRTKLRQSGYL